jgi:anti-sigma factor RsiW
MALLYGEAPPKTKLELEAHLGACAECRQQMQTWRSASRQLDAWTLPARVERNGFASLPKFAAAAAVLALAVIGGVRMAALNNEVSQLRAELRREVSNRDVALAQVTGQATKAASMEAQSLVTEFAKAFEEKRVEDQQLVLATLQQLETKHAQDYTALRKDLETVAVLTEAGLRHAHNEIANIAYEPEPK